MTRLERRECNDRAGLARVQRPRWPETGSSPPRTRTGGARPVVTVNREPTHRTDSTPEADYLSRGARVPDTADWVRLSPVRTGTVHSARKTPAERRETVVKTHCHKRTAQNYDDNVTFATPAPTPPTGKQAEPRMLPPRNTTLPRMQQATTSARKRKRRSALTR